jgi:hypothetical protein
VDSNAASREGEYADRIKLIEPYAIALGSDDSLYFIDGPRIKKVTSPFPNIDEENVLLPSEDGTELYLFNPKGKHLETLHATTGARKYKFEYTPENMLESVIDGFGNKTILNRTSTGDLISIVAPFGQTTLFDLTDEKYIESVQNASGESYRLCCPGSFVTVGGII